MAWTQTDLATLEKAIADGVMEVKYEDKTVKYRSLAEMLKIRDLIRGDLGLNSGNNRRAYPSHSKGL